MARSRPSPSHLPKSTPLSRQKLAHLSRTASISHSQSQWRQLALPPWLQETLRRATVKGDRWRALWGFRWTYLSRIGTQKQHHRSRNPAATVREGRNNSATVPTGIGNITSLRCRTASKGRVIRRCCSKPGEGKHKVSTQREWISGQI